MKNRFMHELLAVFVLAVNSVRAVINDDNNGVLYWDRTNLVDKSWFDKTKSVFTISNAFQLAGLAALVNDKVSGTNFVGSAVHLSDDIDLSITNAFWVPIGATNDDGYAANNGYHFGGEFDGGGHVIANLYVRNGDTRLTVYGGLFGVVQKSGRIQNLRLRNATIDVEGTGDDDYTYAGGIAAVLAGSISNCMMTGSNQVNAIADKYVVHAGLIAGHTLAGAVIADCSVKGDVSTRCYRESNAASVSATGTGGLVGRNYAQICRCWYGSGTVAAQNTNGWTADVGGAVGLNDDGGTLTNVHVSAELISADFGGIVRVGGLVGYSNSGRTINCRMDGVVYGSSSNDTVYVGGVCGGATAGQIKNNVSAAEAIYGECLGENNDKKPNVGGLLGWQESGMSASTLTNNYWLAGTANSYREATKLHTVVTNSISSNGTLKMEAANYAYSNAVSYVENGDGTSSIIEAFVGMDLLSAAESVTNLNAGATAMGGGCFAWKVAYDQTPDFAENNGQTTDADLTGGVPVPHEWIETYFVNDLLAANGDWNRAACLVNQPNGLTAWQAYLLGITNSIDRFWAHIEMSNGEPVISWSPSNELANVVYTVRGATNLSEGASSSWPERQAGHRFFRVRAEWR